MAKGSTQPFQFLRSLLEFSEVPDGELQEIANYSRFANLDAGQYITTEGEDESINGYIVVSGVLAMLKTSNSGKELIVELLQAGDIFGLLLMLAKERLPSQLSARSIRKSTILWVPLKHFTTLLENHPALFKEFVAHLLISLQSSYKLSRGLAHDRVDVRIAAAFSSLAIKFPKSNISDNGIVLNFTRQQLADLTGTTPETAIRVTRTMQGNGLIDISRPGIIRLLNINALNDLAEEW